MKKLSVLLITALSLYSCGKSDKSIEQLIKEGDLTEIRAKKAELSTQQGEISGKIAQLDEAIEDLDGDGDMALVETGIVADTLFRHYVELPGDVETDQNIIINPEFSGVLLEVKVKEGDQVRKGQVLARIDDGGLSNQLAQLQTQAALAKTTFERQGRLWEQKIGSEIQYLEAKANYEAIGNSVDQLSNQLSKTVVRAPFSGVIDKRFADEGEVVAPGQSRLFRLINLSDMYITTAVPEFYLGKIRKGTEVLVELASTGTEFKSKIEQVGNFINPNNRTFEVKVAVPQSNNQIKPNQIAIVKLNDYTSEKAIIVPEDVIQKNSQGENISFVIKPENDSIGIAEKRVLKTGHNYQGKVEVLEGLLPGEIIILEGARSVHEGEQVKFRN